MLATTGFENGHSVKIYDTVIVTNTTAMKIAEGMNDPENHPVPDPVTEEKIYIECKVPQAKSGFHGQITPNLKKNFALTWKAFSEGKEKANDKGTPLEAMPDMSQSIKEHLEKAGFKTLESIAEANDTVVAKFPFGMKMKQKAMLVLESMDSDKLDSVVDEMGEMREIIKEQQKKIDALTSKKTTKKKATG